MISAALLHLLKHFLVPQNSMHMNYLPHHSSLHPVARLHGNPISLNKEERGLCLHLIKSTMSPAQKLYPVIPRPTGFIHYQALENHIQTTRNQIKTTQMKWAVYGFEVFETWGSFEISVGLFDLFEWMCIANNVQTRRHTVNLLTQDDVVFFSV